MLHPSRWLRSFALLGLLGGCGSTIIVGSPPEDAGTPVVDAGSPVVDAGTPVVDAGTPVDRPTPIVDAGARRCTRPSDCARGQQCLGAEGCGVPWTCQATPGRTCTGDVAPFCGCDGVTFGASSTCPDRPYQSRGPCEMPPPPPLDGGVGPTACVLPDGRVCALGEVCDLPDRCTQCRCTSRGLQCTATPCVDGGTPPPRDAGPPTCSIRGVTCRVGEPCLIDRCVLCRCDPSGNVSCQVNPACGVDGGPVPVDGGPIAVDGGPAPVDASVPGCAAQDATGQGLCNRLLGIFWQSNRCVAVGGCSCAGADCGGSYPSFEACEMAHVICPR